MEIPAPVVEVVEIGRLVPWELNPRTDHAVEGIAASMEAFGYLSPIVAQRGTYRVLAGHGRLKALLSRGVERVPVIVADVDDNQADLFTLADNKLTELAKWDFSKMADLLLDFDARNLDVELTGFSDEEVRRIMSWTEVAAPSATPPAEERRTFPVVVSCSSEREQAELISRLAAEGLNARAGEQ